MKIPVHLLALGTSGGKSAQTVQSSKIADSVIKDTSESKDFSRALKSLQNLTQQSTQIPRSVQSVDGAVPPAAKSAKAKVVPLKLVDSKLETVNPDDEKALPQGDDSASSQEVDFSLGEETDVKTEHVTQFNVAPKEKTAPPSRVVAEPDLAERTVDIEGAENDHLPDEADSHIEKNQDSDAKTQTRIEAVSSLSSIIRPASTDQISAQRFDAQPAKPDTAKQPAELLFDRTPLEVNSKTLDMQFGADTATSVLQAMRPAITFETNERRVETSRFEMKINRTIEKVTTDPASIQQGTRLAENNESSELVQPTRTQWTEISNDTKSVNHFMPQAPAKNAASSEAEQPTRAQWTDLASETKSVGQFMPQIQTKNSTGPQLNSVNLPAAQPAPPTLAGEVSTQLSRHLSSELINMDLRAQLVSNRSPNAINASILTLQLHPIGLGRVQAEIRRDGEMVRIKLTVEAASTFEIMKGDIDVLKAAMRALGTAEGDVTLLQGNINRLPNEGTEANHDFFAHDHDQSSEMNSRDDRQTSKEADQEFADDGSLQDGTRTASTWSNEHDPVVI